MHVSKGPAYPLGRLIWVTAIVLLATNLYGTLALQIALCAHAGIHFGALLIKRLLGQYVSMTFSVFTGWYLMYYTVVHLGWGCWFVLFLSFLVLNRTRNSIEASFTAA